MSCFAEAERLFDDMARLGRPTPQLRYREAWMLIQFARNYAIRGDTGKQRSRAAEAHRLLASLAEEKPSDTNYQQSLAAAHDEIGNVLVAQGDLAEALASYRASLAIRERLAASDRNNAGWQYDLGVSHERIGDILIAQGDLAAALKEYEARRAIIEHLAAADRNKTRAGSAICRCRTTRSATCWWRRASSPRR